MKERYGKVPCSTMYGRVVEGLVSVVHNLKVGEHVKAKLHPDACYISFRPKLHFVNVRVTLEQGPEVYKTSSTTTSLSFKGKVEIGLSKF